MTLVVAAMLAMLAGTVDTVAVRATTGIMSDSSNLKHHTLTQRNLGEKTLLLNTEKRGRRGGCNDGVDGECLDATTHKCHGASLITGKCPGSANIKCCPTPGEPYEGKCEQRMCVDHIYFELIL